MMKRQTSARLGRLALLVAVVVAVFTAATPAPADVTASSAVWAYYSYYIEEGAECRTAASLSVGTEMPRGGREASTPATLSLFLDRFGCEEGTNYGIGTSREIPASDFQFDEHLANATLDTSFVESDRWSGRPVELTLQLEWTDTGELIESQQGHSHLMTPASITNFHYRSVWPAATVSGSISDGETEYMREPALAALQAFDAGTVFIDQARMRQTLLTAAAATVGPADTRASYATAHWTDIDPTGCTMRDVVLIVTDSYTHSPGGGAGGTDLFTGVTSYNSCTNETPYWIFGDGRLDENKFSMSQLNDASLAVSIEAIDSVSLMPVTIDFDVTWTGDDEMTRYSNGFIDYFLGRRLNMHETGSYRDASASGTISIGSLSVLPDQFDTGLLGQSHLTVQEVSP